MFEDQMTPKERMRAFAKGEPIDRLPIVPDMGVTMSAFIGETTYAYYTSADVICETEVALFKRFRHDSVGVSTTLRGMAEAMGSIMQYPEDGISLLERPVVQSPEDIDRLHVIDPHKDGKLPMLLEALEKIRDRIGKEADIGASMTGPFSVAASVVGTEQLLRMMVRAPEALHKLMRVVTDCNEAYIRAVGELGFSVGFCDPVSSTSLLKPAQFQAFSLPYLRENIEHVQRYTGGKATLHICGKSRALWEDCVEAGIGNFSIDNIESLQEAKEVMGSRVMITGNVPPVDCMYLGTPEDVRRAVRQCIRDAWDSPCGYILSTGCQIPKGTDIRQIDAFMAAGREFGAYPIDPEKLNAAD